MCRQPFLLKRDDLRSLYFTKIGGKLQSRDVLTWDYLGLKFSGRVRKECLKRYEKMAPLLAAVFPLFAKNKYVAKITLPLEQGLKLLSIDFSLPIYSKFWANNWSLIPHSNLQCASLPITNRFRLRTLSVTALFKLFKRQNIGCIHENMDIELARAVQTLLASWLGNNWMITEWERVVIPHEREFIRFFSNY